MEINPMAAILDNMTNMYDGYIENMHTQIQHNALQGLSACNESIAEHYADIFINAKQNEKKVTIKHLDAFLNENLPAIKCRGGFYFFDKGHHEVEADVTDPIAYHFIVREKYEIHGTIDIYVLPLFIASR